jgi:hypothetical protein
MSAFFAAGSEDLLEVTIAVNGWPLRFGWEDRFWEAVDYTNEPVILKASTVRELVAKHRMEI